MVVFRMLKWVGAVVLLVVVALVLYLSFGDLGWIQPRAETMIGEATGRELKIAGTFSLNVLPAPSLVAEEVTFTNAEWGSEPLMAEVGHLSARVNLWSLLSGPIRVEDVRLRDVKVLLETGPEGEANWDVMPESEVDEEAAEKGGPAEALAIPAIVEKGEIRNVTVTIRGPEDKVRVATVESLDIETDVAQVALDGHGQAGDFAWRIDGLIGAWDTTENPLLLRIDAVLGDLELHIGGQVTNSPTLEGTELTVDASAEDVGPVLEMLGAPLALSGPLRADGEVAVLESGGRLMTADIEVGEIEVHTKARFEGEAIDFEVTVSELDKIGAALGTDMLPPARLTLAGNLIAGATAVGLHDITAQLGETTAQIDGSVGTGPEGTTEVSLSVAGPSLAQLMSTLPELPFAVETTVQVGPQQLTVDPLTATFGDSDLAGSLTLHTAEPMAISGRVQSKLLDLTPFAGGADSEAGSAGADGAEGGASASATGSAEPADAEESQWLLVEDPLPLEALHTSTVDLAFEIGRFVNGNLVYLDLNGSVLLDKGRLALETELKAPSGGDAVVDMNLDSAADPPRLDLNLQARDFKLSVGSVDPDNIPTLNMTLDIQSAGDSPRTLASAANGRALLTVGPGQIENSSAGFLSNDFISEFFGALNPVAEKSEYSRLDCMVVAADLDDGLAEFSTLFVQSETLMILGVGDVDLNTEELNLEFNTKPREGVGISVAGFVTPFIKLKGTLSDPSVGVDKEGVLVSGGLAVATGGMSLLFQGAASRATAGGDRCAEVLAVASEGPPVDD